MSWSDLPADVVAGIAEKIPELADLARFRLVCPSWRSASAAQADRRVAPLLLLPSELCGQANRRLWSPAHDRTVAIPMPAARGFSFLFASPHGWTLGVAGDLSTTLMHPFTGASASLPKLPSTFHDRDQRILRDLLWDRSPDAVVVSTGKGAFFCRTGDGSWSPAGCSPATMVSSITYCDGAFHLLDERTNKLVAVDGATFAVAVEIEPPDLVLPRTWSTPESTLVASSTDADLFLIVRTHVLQRTAILATRDFFKIFRADRRTPTGWTEVSDIGDRAVFVDHLGGFFAAANGLNGVRRNCMYVASSHQEVNDDYGMDVNGRYTVSVLHFADLTIEHLWFGNLLKEYCSRFWQFPSWIMPTLH